MPPKVAPCPEPEERHTVYSCEACRALQPLPETAATVCQRCGLRVLKKRERQPLRTFVTD